MNYYNTFIAVAPDTTASTGSEPPERGGKKSIARLEYELVAARPHALTQEEVQFAVHVRRLGLTDDEVAARRDSLWREYFARPLACMRTSPLARTYGWGLHFDADGKVALVGMESEDYGHLEGDPSLTQTQAMRRKRAGG